MAGQAGAQRSATEAEPGPVTDACNVDVVPLRLARLVLDVTVSCNVVGELTLRSNGGRMASFVSNVRDASGRRIEAQARDWTVSGDAGVPAVIAYRFDLDGYLDEANRETIGIRRGETRLALLDSWLLQPLARGLALPVGIRVEQTPDIRFATGLRFSGGRWRLDDIRVRYAGYTVFGNFQITSVPVPAPGALGPQAGAGSTPAQPASIDLVIMEGELTAPADHIADWVRQSATAVASYFDGYSANQSLVVVLPARGKGVPFGRVVPGGGISMVVRVGSSTPARALYDEWVLIHEMIHTASPFVFDGGTWLMEGLATYLEPVIRYRAGWKSEAEVWREWLDNMDRGLDALTVTGLRNTNAPYWGGALFMLLADIDLRRATGMRIGLEDCLRSVLQGGDNAVERWPARAMLDSCDRLAGQPVLARLAERFVDGKSPFDLPGLWRDLGVRLRDGVIVYDDRAPLAAIRALIVKGPAARQGRTVPLGRT